MALLTEPALRYYGVGINAYPSSPLQGCVRDVHNLIELLEPRGWECSYLLDAAATGAEMEHLWREGVELTKPKDALIVHYSGHGSQGPSTMEEGDRLDECLVDVQMEPFWDNRLGAILQDVHPHARVFVILDCCHSHTGTRLLAPLGVASAGDSYRKSKSLPTALLRQVRGVAAPTVRDLARDETRPIVEFAACRSDQVTYDAQINGVIQGCYTRAFIDAVKALDDSAGLRGYNVTMLQRAIRERLPSQEYDNEPQTLATPWQYRWKALRASGVR